MYTQSWHDIYLNTSHPQTRSAQGGRWPKAGEWSTDGSFPFIKSLYLLTMHLSCIGSHPNQTFPSRGRLPFDSAPKTCNCLCTSLPQARSAPGGKSKRTGFVVSVSERKSSETLSQRSRVWPKAGEGLPDGSFPFMQNLYLLTMQALVRRQPP